MYSSSSSCVVVIVVLLFSVLQVCDVGRASSVLNGAVGESIVLTTRVAGPIQAALMQWQKDNVIIIQMTPNGTTKTQSQAFKGRLTLNKDTGALNISDLRDEDFGKYVFNGFDSKSIGPIEVQLQVYGRIISVRVNSTNSSSCNVTLSCMVEGGSQVALLWSRAGERIVGEENRTVLSVSPSLTEELYSCTATNPLGTQTGNVIVRPCQPHDKLIPSFPLIYILLGEGLLLMVIAATTLICIMKKHKREEIEEDMTVYAEIGKNMQKGNTTTPSTVYDMLKFDRVKTSIQYQEVL
ncbi:hypothetical protein AAFF_G00218560 [Aldrovandia affinis]|uniref:Ig-like domain-containing protein n=1 Tax=Aldrovandia affinis TaxID=143900 RepID=A0AAD7WUK0_9TELE|nr:hypothetical protein AAFF_G00218560 [Aldrovandia affinis]